MCLGAALLSPAKAVQASSNPAMQWLPSVAAKYLFDTHQYSAKVLRCKWQVSVGQIMNLNVMQHCTNS